MTAISRCDPCDNSTLRFVCPRSTRERDGIAAKLLRCGIASEALRRNMSGGRTVPTKRLFKENAPFIFFILMGSFARTHFSRTLLPWPILCYWGQILHARFSNTSFGRTLPGSNYGGLLPEQTYVATLRPSQHATLLLSKPAPLSLSLQFRPRWPATRIGFGLPARSRKKIGKI